MERKEGPKNEILPRLLLLLSLAAVLNTAASLSCNRCWLEVFKIIAHRVDKGLGSRGLVPINCAASTR